MRPVSFYRQSTYTQLSPVPKMSCGYSVLVKVVLICSQQLEVDVQVGMNYEDNKD